MSPVKVELVADVPCLSIRSHKGSTAKRRWGQTAVERKNRYPRCYTLYSPQRGRLSWRIDYSSGESDDLSRSHRTTLGGTLPGTGCAVTNRPTADEGSSPRHNWARPGQCTSRARVAAPRHHRGFRWPILYPSSGHLGMRDIGGGCQKYMPVQSVIDYQVFILYGCFITLTASRPCHPDLHSCKLTREQVLCMCSLLQIMLRYTSVVLSSGPPFPTPPGPYSPPSPRIQVTGQFPSPHPLLLAVPILRVCNPHSTFIQNTTAPSSWCPTTQPAAPSSVICSLQAGRTGRYSGRRAFPCHDEPSVEVEGWFLACDGDGSRRNSTPLIRLQPHTVNLRIAMQS